MKKISVATILSLFLLAGCGLIPLSAAEQGYVDDCKKVQANYNDYIKLQDEIYNADSDDPRYEWQFGSASSLVTIQGDAYRDTARNFIKSEFPWVYSATESYFENIGRAEFLKKSPSLWSFEYEWTVYQDFFRLLANGSSFDVTVDSLKKVDSSSYNLEVDKVFAAYAPSDRFKNCDEALGLKDEESFDSLSNDYGLSSKAVNVGTVLEKSISLWGCETFGVGYIEYGNGWQKCAKKDYVMDVSDYPTSSAPTDEEIAILEERERNAEAESNKPSNSGGTSNVTPGQGCTSLGETVQTESYGSLTCKLVFLNRIKALVWMR